MYRSMMLVLIFLHMLGDFYFQPEALVNKKKKALSGVFIHSGIYAGVFLLYSFAAWSWPVFWLLVMASLLHFAIDLLKFFVVQSLPKIKSRYIYSVDQLLHILTLLIIAYILHSNAIRFAGLPILTWVCSHLLIQPYTLLKWICLFAFIIKPANIIIENITSQYRAAIKETKNSNTSISAFIGILERVAIALLMSVNQYTAIVLVITAKSATRYKRMLDDTNYADYYLVGTLLSTLLVIAAYLILFAVL